MATVAPHPPSLGPGPSVLDTFRAIEAATGPSGPVGLAAAPAAAPAAPRVNWLRLGAIALVVVLVMFVAGVCIKRTYASGTVVATGPPSWLGAETAGEFESVCRQPTAHRRHRRRRRRRSPPPPSTDEDLDDDDEGGVSAPDFDPIVT